MGELFGHLFDSEAYELQRRVQETLSEFEQTYLMSCVGTDEHGRKVYQFITHQHDGRYGFEVVMEHDIDGDLDPKDLFIEQIERMVRNVEEQVLADADMDYSIDDERDEPVFIDSSCRNVMCDGDLFIPYAFKDDGIYIVWECDTCGAEFSDEHDNWDEWV
jgi:hypothetical protein